MSQLYARTPALYVQARRHPYAPWLIGLAILIVVGAVGGVFGAMLFHAKPESGSLNYATSANVQAAGDVKLSTCGVDAKTGWPRATMVVTNSSAARASYVITIAFQSDDGSTQYNSAQTSVADLAPGQKADTVAEGLDAAPRTFTCAVASVHRQ
jgi:hypothetical protein